MRIALAVTVAVFIFVLWNKTHRRIPSASEGSKKILYAPLKSEEHVVGTPQAASKETDSAQRLPAAAPLEPSLPPQDVRNEGTAGFDAKIYTVEEFKRLNPNAQLPDDGKGYNYVKQITSKYGEAQVDFSSLTTDCAALESLEVPVTFRISGNGFIVEAIPLDPEAEIPATINNCKFEGGPSTPFNTLFVPKNVITE